MKKKRWLKTLLAGAFLTLVLGIPLVIMALDKPVPTLSFEGVELNMMADGSAQMLFTVYVEDVRYSSGSRFVLDYNPDYLTPSNHKTNDILGRDGLLITGSDFFEFSPSLYVVDGVPQNPFSSKPDKNYADLLNDKVSLSLYIEQSDLEEDCGLEKISTGESVSDTRFVFNSLDRKTALGTLSFRVTDLSKLPEIEARFKVVQGRVDPTVNGDYLVRFSAPAGQPDTDPWAIGSYVGAEGAAKALREIDSKTKEFPSWGLYAARSTFTFRFPETIIRVDAAEAELTLDAYRGYTDGTVEDIAAAMQKYSPSVVATYSNGSQRTFILPWAGCTVTGGLADPYDPTHGSYQIEQDFSYTNAAGQPVVFPVPVKARLTVTPVTLQAVAADDLHKTYALNDDLVGEKGVQTPAQFKLPSQARLVTDIPAGGASLTIAIPGWSPTKVGSAWPEANGKPSTLLADESTDAAPIHWPTVDDVGQWATVTNQRKGTYTFTMAAAYGGAPVKYAKADIQTAYPWMSVTDNPDTLVLPDATRKLAGETVQFDPSCYHVEYSATTTDAHGNPELALKIKRTGKGSQLLEDMAADAKFRILLPDGTELGTGLDFNGSVGGAVKVDHWFADKDINYSNYTEARVVVDSFNNKNGYELTASPGDTGVGSGGFAAERERLRRYVNLGGWFAVSINENPDAYVWSDFIPVYVPPRENSYVESKEYNFVGVNAGLFRWPGGLGTTVAMPQGSYWPVNALGERLYVDAATGADTTVAEGNTPKSERYGLATTYNGATGAEPGELSTFTVGSWTTSAVDPITTYGADAFKNGANYPAFGNVTNPGAKTAQIRKEGTLPGADTEGIKLTYDGSSGVTSDSATGNVTLVTYDTRTQGYTIRQDYTLTITNVGTTDIYGLEIGNLTNDSVFIMLKPPASFLPAGSSTTFTLSYVYGLTTQNTQMLEYADTLYITSTSHPTAGTDYLRKFDAQFRVSASDIHRVLVKVDPADGCMGTAQVIIGEKVDNSATPPYSMDLTTGTTAFKKDEPVYIMVAPADEYKVKENGITCVDSSGALITLSKYVGGDGSMAGKAEVPDGVEVYTFTMPDYDTTVTVEFFEPIRSKLRLSDLNVYAGEQADNLGEYDIWQKAYTEKEQKDALAWATANNKAENEYLMTCGTAKKAGLTVPGTDATLEQYLVVIPFEAEFAQVEVALRKVLYELAGANKDITPDISMYLYAASPVADGTVTKTSIMTPPQKGDTATQSRHKSEVFTAPEPAASVYVQIELSFKEGSLTTTRSYYVEIHRMPEEVIAALGYGNSPYGMIMNDAGIDGEFKDDKGLTAKDRAKKAFVSNGHSFRGLATGVPKVVIDNGLQETRYWTEAWVGVNDLYDPESHIGLGFYDPKNNLDLSDTSFFALLEQPFLDPGLLSATDSSGRPADITKATISLKAITLDTTQTQQTLRFKGPDPTDADAVAARTATLNLGKAGAAVTGDWWNSQELRPGLYALEYSFPDYDNTAENPSNLTVKRNFILLAAGGDVTADGAVTTGVDSDEIAIKDRVTAPLGYMAEEYPAAAIFKFRSCDGNNDRNINNIDANAIRAGLLCKFYLPTAYKAVPTP